MDGKYENLVKAVGKLMERDSTAYQSAEDSLGYCIFCGSSFQHRETCEWETLKEEYSKVTPAQKKKDK